MTRTPFDQFSKQLLETLLTPLGHVNLNREVPGEARWIDLWFEPSLPIPSVPGDLGLVAQMAATACLIEPFRQQPTRMEVFQCKAKLLAVFGELQRQADRENRRIPDSFEGLPWLWILTPTASAPFLTRLGLTPDPEAIPGLYFDLAHHTALVAMNQLPSTEDTLWLRLLGKGRTQQRAIAEVLAFPLDDPRRWHVLQLLVTWKISLEISGLVEQEEDAMVQLSQAYLEWEQRTEQRGIEQGIERGIEQGIERGIEQGIERGIEQGERSLILRLLTRKFGELPDSLQSPMDRLTLSQLENLGEALLDFATLTDLETWLAQNSGKNAPG
jgi:hypothetical protein